MNDFVGRSLGSGGCGGYKLAINREKRFDIRFE